MLIWPFRPGVGGLLRFTWPPAQPHPSPGAKAGPSTATGPTTPLCRCQDRPFDRHRPNHTPPRAPRPGSHPTFQLAFVQYLHACKQYTPYETTNDADPRRRPLRAGRVPPQELQLGPVRGRRRARALADPDQAPPPPRGPAGRELTLKEAAEVVHVSLPAASRMVDDLVRRGFVLRHEDEERPPHEARQPDRHRPGRDPAD